MVLLITLSVLVALVGCQSPTPAAVTIPIRDQIPEQYKWRLQDIYASDDLWEQDFVKVRESTPALKSYEGRLGESARVLADFLTLKDSVYQVQERLYVYAGMRRDEDLTNNKYQGMSGRASTQRTELEAATAFARPEILSINDSRMTDFLQDRNLAVYKVAIDNIMRLKPHTLTDPEEKLMALGQDVMGSPRNVHGLLIDADFTWPVVKDGQGRDFELANSRYYTLLGWVDRKAREAAYNAYLTPYESHQNTMAALYVTEVNAHIFNARARGYGSSLEAALDGPGIPVSVYTSLVDAVGNNLVPLHRWTSLRKEVLGVDELRPYDVFVTLFPGAEKKYTYEEAKALLRAAFKPLGKDYLAVMEEGFNKGWIDLYATENKRGGAYSWGTYGAHPYMLMNYGETLTTDDVLTLAHEMGHSIHSYFSDKNQPYVYSSYEIFVAEVASTTNEILVLNYLLQNSAENQRLPILEAYLNKITLTFYGQVRYAEFEKLTHEKAENGEALTPDVLAGLWSGLLQKYWGPEMKVTANSGVEWGRIPHFYRNFYVYSYATSIAAAETLSRKLLTGDTSAVEAYLALLYAGCSDSPVSLLKKAGVDMTSPEPVTIISGRMADLVSQVKTVSAGK